AGQADEILESQALLRSGQRAQERQMERLPGSLLPLLPLLPEPRVILPQALGQLVKPQRRPPAGFDLIQHVLEIDPNPLAPVEQGRDETLPGNERSGLLARLPRSRPVGGRLQENTDILPVLLALGIDPLDLARWFRRQGD